MEKNWLIFVVIAALWSIPWKGVALWKSAKNGHKIWFIALLLVNTLAILEIIYIFFFAKKKIISSEKNTFIDEPALEKQIIPPKRFV